MSEAIESSSEIIEPIPETGSVQTLEPKDAEYLPEEAHERSTGQMRLKTEFLARHHSGPLPDPETLAEYERVLPGAAERIFSRFEKQSDHRMTMEGKVITSNTSSQRIGTIGSVAFAVLALLSSVYLVHEGKSLSGLTMFIGTVGSVGGTFVYGKHTQQRERESALRSRESARKTGPIQNED